MSQRIETGPYEVIRLWWLKESSDMFMFKSAICVAFSSEDSEETIDVDAFGLAIIKVPVHGGKQKM
jgi:hypothetical protein